MRRTEYVAARIAILNQVQEDHESLLAVFRQAADLGEAALFSTPEEAFHSWLETWGISVVMVDGVPEIREQGA